MKKLFAIVLCLVMVLSLVACGEEAAPETTTEPTTTTEEPTTTTEATEEITEEVTEEVTEDLTGEEEIVGTADPSAYEALDVINTVLDAYNAVHAGTDLELGVAGGGYLNSNWGGADVVFAEDTDFLTGNLQIPEEEIGNIQGTASAMHMMMLNNFCVGAYKLVDGADVQAFMAAVQNQYLTGQWMCGIPEQAIVVEVDGIVLAGYGLNNIMENFIAAMVESYPNATIMYNGPVA